MGNHLVQILNDGKHDVFVTSRSQRQNRPGVTYIQGNAHDDNFLDQVLNMNYNNKNEYG